MKSLFLVFILSITVAVWAQDNSQDSKDINKVVQGFVSAWNNHDAKAMASYWSENGDVLNPWGNWAHTKNEVQELFQKDQEGPFKQSSLQLKTTKIRYVPGNNNVAVVDVDGEATGLKFPTVQNSERITHHIVFVMFKQNGTWKIFAARPYKLVKDIVNDISPVNK